MASVIISLLLDKYLPSIFATFRNYTYQIFLMGIFVQILIKIFFKRGLIPNYEIAYILCIAMGIYVPVIICMIVKKVNIRCLNLCLGLGK